MNEQKAVAVATSLPEAQGLNLISAKRAIIEIGENRASLEASPGPGRTRDVMVWLVVLGQGSTGVCIAIEDETAVVVRLQKTMGSDNGG